MASYNNFQTDRYKYKNYADINKQYKIKKNIKEINGEKRKNLILWITYYRKNIHRFINDYFGVKLFWFQIIWIFLIHNSSIAMIIASRGISKSWIIGLYATAKCVLYPYSKFVIVAGTKDQAGVIIKEKIRDEFYKKYPNIEREIADIKTQKDDLEVIFHNNSTIKVVVGGDGARGKRATDIIFEEFRLVSKKVMDEIIIPMLIPRQPLYLSNPKYKKFYDAIENRKIYISSAYYKTANEGFMWKEMIAITKDFLKGKDVCFMAANYLLAIFHRLKTKKGIEQERKSCGEVSFAMEYQNLMYDEDENAFFKLDMFKGLRKLKKVFYPVPKLETKIDKKYKIDRKPGEYRLVSVDVALKLGEVNDNTAITCIRLIPQKNGYVRQFVYQEVHHGITIEFLTLRIKQLFTQFESNYIVLDVQNQGLTLFESLSKVTSDEEFGIEYDGYTIYGDTDFLVNNNFISSESIKDLQRRTISVNALPVIFPISGSSERNTLIARELRNKLNEKMIELPIDPIDAEELILKKEKKEAIDDINYKLWLLNPFIQAEQTINETINLVAEIRGANIKLTEQSKFHRKDRYSSFSYGNFVASALEKEHLLKETKKKNVWEDYIWIPKCGFELVE